MENEVFSLILSKHVSYEGYDVNFLGTFRSIESLLDGFVAWVEADDHPALAKELSGLKTVEQVNEVLDQNRREFRYSYDSVYIEVTAHKIGEVILPNAM